MPKTKVLIFAEKNGSSPFIQWVKKQPQKVQNKCYVFIERLTEFGYGLRRPQADYLKDDIYELRVNRQGINYRVLYFFCEEKAIISHGIVKQMSKVPDKEINIAVKNKMKFLANPGKHTYKEEQ